MSGAAWLVYRYRHHYTATTLLTNALILAVVVAIIAIGQEQALKQRVREACSETGAAAKLDLSSFVPVCLEVKR
jgi:hypothetical protein